MACSTWVQLKQEQSPLVSEGTLIDAGRLQLVAQVTLGVDSAGQGYQLRLPPLQARFEIKKGSTRPITARVLILAW
ncbi:hypothetical protein C1890_27825 [Pseudomonas sp. DP16D-R1]|nr:hypothetical protein C1890_27825 [Pseudomonas sp. DP16D-R1]